MAIKNLIAHGIGFSPGSVKFIVTLGFDIGAVGAPIVYDSMFGREPKICHREGAAGKEVRMMDVAAKISIHSQGFKIVE